MEMESDWSPRQRNAVVWMVALAAIIELWLQGVDALLREGTDRFWVWTFGAILVAAIAFQVEGLKLRGEP